MELGNQNYSTAAGAPNNESSSTFDKILASIRDGISTYQDARSSEAGKINGELGPRGSFMPLVILAAVVAGAFLLLDD